MKTTKEYVMKSIGTLVILWMLISSGCASPAPKIRESKEKAEYYVAAYVWPSCHNDERGRELLWSEGIGEWEMIQKGNPRFEGHYQPRVPLWGYEMDNDPLAVEKKIEAAAGHGVNVFIYDWYWYDGKPFLESALNDGFLKARNNEKMKFYIMWANHDVPGNMWNHYRYKTNSLIWTGAIDQENYEIIVERIIRQYFKRPNYLKFDGKPVFSIFSLPTFIKSFNGLQGARKALDYFRAEVEKAGFPGLHIQVTGWTKGGKPFLADDPEGRGVNEIANVLGIDSVTIYNWVATGLDEDYLKWAENAMKTRDMWDSILDIPYIPHVSIGWDDTPRYPKKGKKAVVHINNTPESFAAYLRKAKEFVDNRPEQPKLITINAWNEWVEGSYLEPDMRWRYGYLEAVKKVMSGTYDVSAGKTE
jgi:hypothetical protein